jgi:hypothetical protein
MIRSHMQVDDIMSARGVSTPTGDAVPTTWRCDTCMVESSLDKIKCGVCGAAKAGSVPQSTDEAKTTPFKFSFGQFSFGDSAGGKTFSVKPSSAGEESDAVATAPAAVAKPSLVGGFVFGASQPATTTSKFPSVGQAKGKPTFGSTFGQSKAAAESPNPKPNPFRQSKAAAAAESHALKPSIFERSKAAARSPSSVHADRQAVIAEARRAHAKQTTADGAADGLPSSPPPAAESPNPKPTPFGQSKAAAAPAASATSPRSPSGVKDDMTEAAIAEALITKRAQAKQTTADGAEGGLLPTPPPAASVGSDHAAEPHKPASIFGQSKGGAASAAPQAHAQPKLSFSFGKPAAVVSGAPTLSGIGRPSTATASGPVSPAGGGLKFAFGQSKGGFSSQAGIAAASTASPAQPKLSFSFGAKPGAGAAPKAADGSGDDTGDDGAADGGDDENSEGSDDDNEDDGDKEREGNEDEDEEKDEEREDGDTEDNPKDTVDSKNDGGSEAGDGVGDAESEHTQRSEAADSDVSVTPVAVRSDQCPLFCGGGAAALSSVDDLAAKLEEYTQGVMSNDQQLQIT